MRPYSVLTLMSRQIGQPGTDHELGTAHTDLSSDFLLEITSSVTSKVVIMYISSEASDFFVITKIFETQIFVKVHFNFRIKF